MAKYDATGLFEPILLLQEEHGRAAGSNGDRATIGFHCAWLGLCAVAETSAPASPQSGLTLCDEGAFFPGTDVETKFAIRLAVAAVLLPSAASAQALLPPHEIITSVRSAGLDPISAPQLRRGDRYVLRAIDRRGALVAVAADAATGRVLVVRPAGAGRGPEYAERAYPPDDRENFAPRRGAYEGQPLATSGEPRVIYAPRDNAALQTPARNPAAAKPSPKVAAKPSARSSEPEAAPTSGPDQSRDQPQDATTGTTSSVPPPAENPSAAVPPVQSFD